MVRPVQSQECETLLVQKATSANRASVRMSFIGKILPTSVISVNNYKKATSVQKLTHSNSKHASMPNFKGFPNLPSDLL
jgi:hypothetical protein